MSLVTAPRRQGSMRHSPPDGYNQRLLFEIYRQGFFIEKHCCNFVLEKPLKFRASMYHTTLANSKRASGPHHLERCPQRVVIRNTTRQTKANSKTVPSTHRQGSAQQIPSTASCQPHTPVQSCHRSETEAGKFKQSIIRYRRQRSKRWLPEILAYVFQSFSQIRICTP